MGLLMSPFGLSILFIFTSLAALAFSKNVILDQTEACFVFKVLPSLYEISVYSRGIPLGTQKGKGRELFCFSNGKTCFYTTTKISRGKYHFCMYANVGFRLTLTCILRDVVH
ncbi:Hypothetical predicted protein [Octopus vulgaris]|nr:Hypothetical predicted protein [Octopus vulgaris]